MVKNDKTDPDGPDDPDGNAAAAAVDCAAVESKGGAVAELAPRYASNPGKGGRLVARDVASPFAPKYGSGGAAAASAGAAAASAAAAVAVMPVPPVFFFCGSMWFVVGFVRCRQF